MKSNSEKTNRNRCKENESLSHDELRAVICSIKRKAEAEFQESLKHMTPEEREKAIEFANALL